MIDFTDIDTSEKFTQAIRFMDACDTASRIYFLSEDCKSELKAAKETIKSMIDNVQDPVLN